MLPQTEALLLEDVLLDARDGLVLSKKAAVVSLPALSLVS